jgi:hypothetical protein
LGCHSAAKRRNLLVPLLLPLPALLFVIPQQSGGICQSPQVPSANIVSKSPFAFRHGFRLFGEIVYAMKNCEEIGRIETFLRQLLAAYFSCLASFPVISYV